MSTTQSSQNGDKKKYHYVDVNNQILKFVMNVQELLCSSNVGLNDLRKAQLILRPTHYLSVLEERTSNCQCAWALCQTKLTPQQATPKSSIDLVTQTLVPDDPWYFCSAQCEAQSKQYLSTLSDDPVNTRPVLKAIVVKKTDAQIQAEDAEKKKAQLQQQMQQKLDTTISSLSSNSSTIGNVNVELQQKQQKREEAKQKKKLQQVDRIDRDLARRPIVEKKRPVRSIKQHDRDDDDSDSGEDNNENDFFIQQQQIIKLQQQQQKQSEQQPTPPVKTKKSVSFNDDDLEDQCIIEPTPQQQQQQQEDDDEYILQQHLSNNKSTPLSHTLSTLTNDGVSILQRQLPTPTNVHNLPDADFQVLLPYLAELHHEHIPTVFQSTIIQTLQTMIQRQDPKVQIDERFASLLRGARLHVAPSRHDLAIGRGSSNTNSNNKSQQQQQNNTATDNTTNTPLSAVYPERPGMPRRIEVVDGFETPVQTAEDKQLDVVAKQNDFIAQTDAASSAFARSRALQIKAQPPAAKATTTTNQDNNESQITTTNLTTPTTATTTTSTTNQTKPKKARAPRQKAVIDGTGLIVTKPKQQHDTTPITSENVTSASTTSNKTVNNNNNDNNTATNNKEISIAALQQRYRQQRGGGEEDDASSGDDHNLHPDLDEMYNIENLQNDTLSPDLYGVEVIGDVPIIDSTGAVITGPDSAVIQQKQTKKHKKRKSVQFNPNSIETTAEHPHLDNPEDVVVVPTHLDDGESAKMIKEQQLAQFKAQQAFLRKMNDTTAFQDIFDMDTLKIASDNNKEDELDELAAGVGVILNSNNINNKNKNTNNDQDEADGEFDQADNTTTVLPTVIPAKALEGVVDKEDYKIKIKIIDDDDEIDGADKAKLLQQRELALAKLQQQQQRKKQLLLKKKKNKMLSSTSTQTENNKNNNKNQGLSDTTTTPALSAAELQEMLRIADLDHEQMKLDAVTLREEDEQEDRHAEWVDDTADFRGNAVEYSDDGDSNEDNNNNSDQDEDDEATTTQNGEKDKEHALNKQERQGYYDEDTGEWISPSDAEEEELFMTGKISKPSTSATKKIKNKKNNNNQQDDDDDDDTDSFNPQQDPTAFQSNDPQQQALYNQLQSMRNTILNSSNKIKYNIEKIKTQKIQSDDHNAKFMLLLSNWANEKMLLFFKHFVLQIPIITMYDTRVVGAVLSDDEIIKLNGFIKALRPIMWETLNVLFPYPSSSTSTSTSTEQQQAQQQQPSKPPTQLQLQQQIITYSYKRTQFNRFPNSTSNTAQQQQQQNNNFTFQITKYQLFTEAMQFVGLFHPNTTLPKLTVELLHSFCIVILYTLAEMYERQNINKPNIKFKVVCNDDDNDDDQEEQKDNNNTKNNKLSKEDEDTIASLRAAGILDAVDVLNTMKEKNNQNNNNDTTTKITENNKPQENNQNNTNQSNNHDDDGIELHKFNANTIKWDYYIWYDALPMKHKQLVNILSPSWFPQLPIPVNIEKSLQSSAENREFAQKYIYSQFNNNSNNNIEQRQDENSNNNNTQQQQVNIIQLVEHVGLDHFGVRKLVALIAPQY